MNLRSGCHNYVIFINKKTHTSAMANKRGFLLSLIIIIGVIFLIMLLIVLAMREELVDIKKTGSSDLGGVQMYVENCIDAVSKYALYKAGKQGGTITLKEDHFSNSFLETNYAFEKQKVFPPLEISKLELEGFIDRNLKNCTAGFAGFGLQGMEISDGDVETEIIFGLRSVIVTVNYPLEIDYQGKTFSLEKFQKDIPVRFKTIHSETDQLVSDFHERYNLDFLNEMDSNIYMTPFEETDLFVEERLGSRGNGDNYLFMFAVG